MKEHVFMELRKAVVFLIILLMNTVSTAYNDNSLPQITSGEPGQKAGDIIAPITVEEMAAWCDFNKQIISTNRGYVCVFNGKPVP